MPVADILITPARVFYAPVGTDLPDENSVGYGDTWPAPWTEVGITLAPLSMSYTRTKFQLRGEQSTGVLKETITEEAITLETTLGELTANNLQLSLGGTVVTTPASATQVGKEELEAGGQVDLDERVFAFEGLYRDSANNRLPVRFLFYRCTSVLNGQLQFAKGAGAGIPLQVEALADLTKPEGRQILKVQKVTAPKTS